MGDGGFKIASRARTPGFIRDSGGAAAAELALWATLMMVPIMSVIDIGFYAFQRMQVELGAQAGIQAIRQTCGLSAVPMTKNCAGLSTAATTAVQSTLLGGSVAVESGYPTEGYYCVNGSQELVLVGSTGTVGSPPPRPDPFNCASVIGGSTASPSAYARVSVTHTYTPVFSGVSVASLLPTPIVRTAWIRLN